MLPRLVTIPISHYGERARWALDFAEIDYEESHHLQMFSWVAAYALGEGKTLPVLVTSERVLTDSAEIVAWASERARVPLIPRQGAARSEILTLAHELAGAFGVEARRITYDWSFAAAEECLPYNAGRAPDYQMSLFSRFRGPGMGILGRYLGVSPAQVTQAVSVVNRTFDQIAERLGDGRRYLIGESFSAADLAFASMSAPCLLPARYGVTLPPLGLAPAPAQARIEAWRAHPAGQFALRLYDERPTPRGIYERPPRVSP